MSQKEKWQKFLESFLPSVASGIILMLLEKLLD